MLIGTKMRDYLTDSFPHWTPVVRSLATMQSPLSLLAYLDRPGRIPF
jgi:hypothetical protein